MDYSSYSSNYSETSFWSKIKSCASKAGRKLITDAFILYYALPDASPKDTAIIIAALGYLICPIDLIPDTLPGGFADDAYALYKAVKSIKGSASPQTIAKAERKAKELLG